MTSACSTALADEERDDILAMAWPTVVSQVDPNIFTGLQVPQTAVNFMGTLVRYDPDAASADEVLAVDELEPELAEEWSVNEDETVYTITLREGVMSPYGNELTTEDVVWSFERHIAGESIAAGVLMPSANVDMEEPIRVIDDHTFEYRLTTPSAVGLSILHYPLMGIYDSTEASSHATEEDPWADEWLSRHSASFGPYNVTSVDPGSEVRMSANPHYWRPDEPKIDNLIIRAVANPASRAQLLMSGEVDLIRDLPYEQLPTLEESDQVELLVNADSNRHNLSLNANDERIQDPRVRRAMSLAIDRQALAEGIYKDYAEPALYAMPSALQTEPATEPVEHDPEAARELLAEAGAEDLTLDMTINSDRPGPYAEDMARLIQADLREVGITMRIRTIGSAADFESAVAGGNLPAFLYSERPTIADSGYLFFLYRQSESSLNNTNYDNPEVDELIDEAMRTPDGPDRDSVVDRLQEIIMEETPVIYLTEVPEVIGTVPDIEGYVTYPHGGVAVSQLGRA